LILGLVAYFLWPRGPTFKFGVPLPYKPLVMTSMDQLATAGAFEASFRLNVNVSIHSDNYIAWNTPFFIMADVKNPQPGSTSHKSSGVNGQLPFASGNRVVSIAPRADSLYGYELQIRYVNEAALVNKADVNPYQSPTLFYLFMSCNSSALAYAPFPGQDPVGSMKLYVTSNVSFLSFHFTGAITEVKISCPQELNSMLTSIANILK
jgi:hypothetical protein